MHEIVGLPIGTRLHRIVRLQHGWRLWIATADYVHGTYLLLHDSGGVERVVVRIDEGDEVSLVRPNDTVVAMIKQANGEKE
jgi:phage gp46-like protein